MQHIVPFNYKLRIQLNLVAIKFWYNELQETAGNHLLLSEIVKVKTAELSMMTKTSLTKTSHFCNSMSNAAQLPCTVRYHFCNTLDVPYFKTGHSGIGPAHRTEGTSALWLEDVLKFYTRVLSNVLYWQKSFRQSLAQRQNCPLGMPRTTTSVDGLLQMLSALRYF